MQQKHYYVGVSAFVINLCLTIKDPSVLRKVTTILQAGLTGINGYKLINAQSLLDETLNSYANNEYTLKK